MVQAIAAFLDFFYIVRQSTLDEADLEAMENALKCFETECTVFEEVQIHPDGISIPHIHALQHYQELVQQLVHLMVFAHPSLSPNIFKLLRSLGEGQTIINISKVTISLNPLTAS